LQLATSNQQLATLLRHAIFGIIAAAILFAAGCGASRRDEPFTQPLPITDARLALGQRAFAANCDQCHPGGAGGEGPSLNDKLLLAPFIKLQVRNGFGAMPAFNQSDIGDNDLDAVVYYIQSLRNLH
jgi:mono/diheme cytochrome c family protein